MSDSSPSHISDDRSLVTIHSGTRLKYMCNAVPLPPAWNYVMSCHPPQIIAKDRWSPHLKTRMAVYQSIGCQLEAVRHCCLCVKKLVGSIIRNRDSDLILEKLRF